MNKKADNKFTRRSFMKRAALAGAAPLILSGRVWAADTAPSEKVTLGFIGTGRQSRDLMSGFLGRNDTRVLAVCDVDTTRRENAKKTVETRYAAAMTGGTYKGCDVYGDFRELLARKDIDGVVIATPDHWHALVAVAAARAGKDIYCEKPMAHTIIEGRAMVNAVRQNKRILQVGSMQRSSREFRTACELVRNGVIGEVKKVDVMVGPPPKPCDLPGQPAEPGLNWDMWLGPAPTREYSSVLSPRGIHTNFPDWRNYLEYGGGMVCDWGAHHFDIAQWAMGFDATGPVEIIHPGTDNAKIGMRLRYANGVEFTHSQERPGGYDGVIFYGDKGKIHVNRGKFDMWMGEDKKASTPNECPAMITEYLTDKSTRLYNSQNQLADWIKCIRDRSLPICDVEIGQRSATVCNLVNAAYLSGKSIKWDAATEKFTDGTDPKWMDREYRGDWAKGIKG